MQPRLFPAASCQPATSLWLLWRSAADAAAGRRGGGGVAAAPSSGRRRAAARPHPGSATPSLWRRSDASTTASARDRRRSLTPRRPRRRRERAADGLVLAVEAEVDGLDEDAFAHHQPVVSTITRCFCRSQPTARPRWPLNPTCCSPTSVTSPRNRSCSWSSSSGSLGGGGGARRRARGGRVDDAAAGVAEPLRRRQRALDVRVGARLVTRRAVAARVGGCWLDSVDERRRERGRVGERGEHGRSSARSRTAGTACRRRIERAAAAAAPRSARGAAPAARRRAAPPRSAAARTSGEVVVGGAAPRPRTRRSGGALAPQRARLRGRKVGGWRFELFWVRNCYWRVRAARGWRGSASEPDGLLRLSLSQSGLLRLSSVHECAETPRNCAGAQRSAGFGDNFVRKWAPQLCKGRSSRVGVEIIDRRRPTSPSAPRK